MLLLYGDMEIYSGPAIPLFLAIVNCNFTIIHSQTRQFNYLYCCIVHFEDSLNITHQQIH